MDQVPGKTKVLFLASDPSDSNSRAIDEEIRAITDKINDAKYRDSIDLISAWAVRLDDLIQLLNQHEPQVVHFSGYGNTSGEIILNDKNGKPRPVSSKALKQLFTTLKDNIKVVVLDGCCSKEQAESITEIIDCTVNMSDVLPDDAAIAFAASFYRAMGFNRNIQDCFEQGVLASLFEYPSNEEPARLLAKKGINPSKIQLLNQTSKKDRKDSSKTDNYKDTVEIQLKSDDLLRNSILKSRIVCLKKNLRSVKNMLKEVENRNEKIWSLGQSVSNIRHSIDEINFLTTLDIKFEKPHNKKNRKCLASEKVDSHIKDIQDEVNKMEEYFELLENVEVSHRNQNYSNANNDRLQDIFKTLNKDLIDRAQHHINRINEIEELLDEEITAEPIKSRDIEVSNPSLENDKISLSSREVPGENRLAKNLWQQFYDELNGNYDELNGNCFEILDEYFNFMCGLALRDLNLMDATKPCLFADKLIGELYNKFDVGSYLCIPATKRISDIGNEEIGHRSTSYIRFNIPECSFWALPLTFREASLKLLEKDESLRNIIKNFAHSDNNKNLLLKECAADALSIFTLGPAYAYACFFMQLNPLESHKEEAHAKRAFAISTIMEHDYEEIREELMNHWSIALHQANIYEDVLEEEKIELKKFVKSLYEYLKQNKELLEYAPKRWRYINSDWLARNILERVNSCDYQCEEFDKLDLKDRLNLGWACRIRSLEGIGHFLLEDEGRIEKKFIGCLSSGL